MELSLQVDCHVNKEFSATVLPDGADYAEPEMTRGIFIFCIACARAKYYGKALQLYTYGVRKFLLHFSFLHCFGVQNTEISG